MRALDFGHLIETTRNLTIRAKINDHARSVANDKRSRDAELMIRMSGCPNILTPFN